MRRALPAVALLVLAGCAAPDPALGTWLCDDRFVDGLRQSCPVDGLSWQIDLVELEDGSALAVWLEGDVEAGVLAERRLAAQPLSDPGAWQLDEILEPVEGEPPPERGLTLACALSGPHWQCAGTDLEATWELRFLPL